MPDYKKLIQQAGDSPEALAWKKHTSETLLRLRKQLKDTVPESKLDFNLLMATWNIREFDSSTYGDRIEESIYYIAEIISAFDLVAVQEVNKMMSGLERVMDLLGRHWQYIISDTTEGTRGNEERIAYVYNSRKIIFGGLAGELVIPPLEEQIDDPDNPGKKKTRFIPLQQLWRTPLISGFTAGWAKFMICNVHIKWGESELSRKEEIDNLAAFLKARTEDKSAWARKLILLGDFNISEVHSESYKALRKAGYSSPPEHDEIYSTVGSDKKQYDRIFVREREGGLKILSGGTLSLFENCFRDEDEEQYRDIAKTLGGKPAASYKNWRTHQLSDHQPLWVEFRIDYADEFLEKLT